MLWKFSVFALLSWIVYAVSGDSVNYFIEPGPPGTAGDFTQNNVYVVGSQISLRWATNFSEISLAIYQNNNASFEYLPNMKFVPPTTSYRWTVDLMDFDIKKGNVFFFDVFAEDGSGRQLTSHYFNISEGASSPSSASSSLSSSSTASLSSAATTATVTVVSANSTPATILSTAGTTGVAIAASAQATANSSSSMSTGAKVGIGVGVSVGVIGIIVGLVAVLLLLRIRRSKRQEGVPLQELGYPMDPPNENGRGYGDGQHKGLIAHQSGQPLNPQEMSAFSEPQELPGAKFDSPRV